MTIETQVPNVLSRLSTLALAISNRCTNRGERWTARAKWWIDVSKWIDGGFSKSFAAIRAERSSR
ncbi:MULTISPECIES: hypothetical protein [Bradyrhizobium]|uniref:hypothetical protein n=1 Tax=Bradyrhizobium TaxID=374 RepID=UPI0004B73807|nr:MULTISPECIES: hypothetical protein [Bradyrhizobium]MDI2075524.1 hypothetical protein [Bradyrhizobium sp. Mp27]